MIRCNELACLGYTTHLRKIPLPLSKDVKTTFQGTIANSKVYEERKSENRSKKGLKFTKMSRQVNVNLAEATAGREGLKN